MGEEPVRETAWSSVDDAVAAINNMVCSILMHIKSEDESYRPFKTTGRLQSKKRKKVWGKRKRLREEKIDGW